MKVIWALVAILLLVLILPWTQNIRGKGKVVTLRPEQRPQMIQSIIAGRIEKWFVKDGDQVKKGDTILFLSEIKESYLDPDLVGRTNKQLKNKELSVVSYGGKINALDNRIDALIETGKLKLQQAKIKLSQSYLKLKTDSIEFHTTQINTRIAEQQYERFEKLYKDNLKSLTEVESRKLAYQRAQASQIAAQQKYLQSANDIIDARVEYQSTEAKFKDEIAKAESDKFSTLSSLYDTEVDVIKLQNQAANYSIRNGMYYVLAPQDGIVTKVLSSGIGETIKQGESLATIMPKNYDLAIEMFVQPVDLPLLKKGQKVRVQFDGWPAMVFSGWPNTSFGTFGGEIFAIDNFANEEGMFRVLVSPNHQEKEWPDALRVGGGAKSMILLGDVLIGYELWRKINGFPPNFYQMKKLEKPKK
ncbi:MAG: HlyD family efflux transporter periplasmic adaptor subunit [Flavobacteriia bacterium]|jgi:multidrug efflux pump subunit AcrA (membrane-fusion protein)